MFNLQEELDSIEKEIKLTNTPQEIKDDFAHSEKIPTNHYIEEWRTVEGFDEYEISSFGRLKNKHGKVTSGSKHKAGYMTTVLSKDNQPYFKYLHILVAESF